MKTGFCFWFVRTITQASCSSHRVIDVRYPRTAPVCDATRPCPDPFTSHPIANEFFTGMNIFSRSAAFRTASVRSARSHAYMSCTLLTTPPAPLYPHASEYGHVAASPSIFHCSSCRAVRRSSDSVSSPQHPLSFIPAGRSTCSVTYFSHVVPDTFSTTAARRKYPALLYLNTSPGLVTRFGFSSPFATFSRSSPLEYASSVPSCGIPDVWFSRCLSVTVSLSRGASG